MNPAVQRYLPPMIVFGSAIYFGMPPSKPLDLGEDIVRATSVRWDKDDLENPSLPPIAVNPFREVIVAEVKPEDAPIQPEAPSGPEPADIQAGLTLDGFADTAGRRWAIVNGRPRLEGDTVSTTGIEPYVCEIVAVEEDRVVVRCQQTLAEIRPQPFGSKKAATSNPSSQPPVTQTDFSPAVEDIAPPPQI